MGASARGCMAVFFFLALSAAVASAADLGKAFAKAVAAGNVERIRTLIDQGADVNAANKEGETALMVASLEGRLDVARLLVERGADLHAKDGVGANALHYAAMGGSLELVKFLVGRGADTEARTQFGDTPASIAEEKGDRAASEFLRAAKK